MGEQSHDFLSREVFFKRFCQRFLVELAGAADVSTVAMASCVPHNPTSEPLNG